MVLFDAVSQEPLEKKLVAIDVEVFLLLVENHKRLSLARTTGFGDSG